MGDYDQIQSRADVPVPEPVAAQIIQDTVKQSVIMANARKVPMSSKTLKQPVLTTLPNAYWVNGDTGMKKTTGAKWSVPVVTAEELAAIAVVPDAIFDDTSIPLWDNLRPLLAEAIGVKVDEAGLFGTDKPTSWPAAIVAAATAAGNVIEMPATGTDIGVPIADLGRYVAEHSGFDINGFVTQKGFKWRLRGIRDDNGQLIYDPAANTLYGLPMGEVDNGSWATTTPATEFIGVDWSKVYVGIRQDITVKLLDQAVISDEEGKVIVNLAQQDAKALRVVFRVGFQVFNPVTRIQPVAANRYPAGVIVANTP